MKLLVCGGREFRDRDLLNQVLDDTLLFPDPTNILIHGGARGADMMAHLWALSKGIQTCCCEANWDYYKKTAGFKRNSDMLLLKPELVIAFPGDNGTESMIRLAKKAKIIVKEIKQ